MQFDRPSAAAPSAPPMASVMLAKSASPAPPPPPRGAAAPVTANVEGGGSDGAAANATFVIPRLATIITGDKPKKVTVAELKLDSKFTHYVVPGLSEKAYLRAQAWNTSDYPLLASQSVSIFFDNSFVAASTMKAVSPGEDFESFLGVDPAVKVEQKPTQKLRDKKGIFSKSNEDRYEVTTVVKNTKKVPLKINIKQALPQPQDKQIKVTMVAPTDEDVKLGAQKVANLAEAEEKGMLHKSHPHPLRKLVEPHNKQWTCDLCKKRTVNRFHCSANCDYDVCDNCWERDHGLKDVVYLESGVFMSWTKVVDPGKEISIPYSYTIQWPLSRQIAIT